MPLLFVDLECLFQFRGHLFALFRKLSVSHDHLLQLLFLFSELGAHLDQRLAMGLNLALRGLLTELCLLLQRLERIRCSAQPVRLSLKLRVQLLDFQVHARHISFVLLDHSVTTL